MKDTINNVQPNSSQIELIKQGLIESCITFNASIFTPYLLMPEVKTSFPDKEAFLHYFEYMLNCTKSKSEGALTLRIENYDSVQGSIFNFYDTVHKFARLTIIVNETPNEISFDVSPI